MSIIFIIHDIDIHNYYKLLN